MQWILEKTFNLFVVEIQPFKNYIFYQNAKYSIKPPGLVDQHRVEYFSILPNE